MKLAIFWTVPFIGALAFGQDVQAQGTEAKIVKVAAVAEQEDEVMFDVKYHDDKGKLMVTSRGVAFEDVSNGKRSKSWSYAQIKGVKKDGDEVKIEPYSGDSMEFHIHGKAMTDEVYRMISDRIVAARHP